MASLKPKRRYRKQKASRPARGPGLAKTTEVPLFERRMTAVWVTNDYRLRELFEAADVMSEGAIQDDLDFSRYYGTTSIILPWRSQGGLIPDEHRPVSAGLLSRDPHARTRAVRVACLEAQFRAGNPIGRVQAELRFEQTDRGVLIQIEVEARVFAQDAGKAR